MGSLKVVLLQPRLRALASFSRRLEEVGDGIWDVYYSHVRLGQMDERILKVEDALGRRMRNPQV